MKATMENIIVNRVRESFANRLHRVFLNRAD